MGDIKLWKYFDVVKFLTLINGEIYFARADKLKDKYEGAIPKQNFLRFINHLGQSGDAFQNDLVKREFLKKFDERKKKAAFSCWHINETESAAMWETYSRAGQGIAIRTTMDKLAGGVRKPQGFEMEIFKVDYIDFDSEYSEQYILNELLPFKNKRKEFEYESEFRVMLYQKNTRSQPAGDGERGFTRPEAANEAVNGAANEAVNGAANGAASGNDIRSAFNDLPPEGIKINIDASQLIDEIIASPDMEQYEVEEIQNILDLICKGKGSRFLIRRSALYENLQY